jgi:hypothetical protein
MAVSMHLSLHPSPEEEPAESTACKATDELHRFRGTFDREPHGICWVRVFEAEARRRSSS